VAGGVVNAFDIPARQSLIVDMLEDRADLPNAIALNSFLFNGARLVGPALAGLTVALAGAGVCFLLNGISFLAVVAALAAMRMKPPVRKPTQMHLRRELREGFSYVMGSQAIRLILLMIALMSFLAMPYAVLMPVFAKDVLHGGEQVIALLGPSFGRDPEHAGALALGLLTAAPGIGALLGALFLASRTDILGLRRIIAVAAGLFGAGLVAFSLSPSLWLSLLILVPVGFGMLVALASGNTLVQSLADDDKRGRVMSFWMMSFMGMAPFGSLLAGLLARNIGAPWTVLLGGLASLVAAIAFGRRLPGDLALAPPSMPASGPLPGPLGAEPPAAPPRDTASPACGPKPYGGRRPGLRPPSP
jgi:MFS family permease